MPAIFFLDPDLEKKENIYGFACSQSWQVASRHVIVSLPQQPKPLNTA